MRIAVFGVGAVGGYFGARLAQAGEEVVWIARGENLAALRERGLRIESPKGDLHLQPVAATDDPADVGLVDVAMLGVKAWQVPEVAPLLAPLVGAGGFALPLQNGVEAPAQLAAVLGREQVVGGLCKIVAERVAPGVVRHGGAEPYVAFGELDGRRSDRCERLRAAFARAGVQAEVPANVHAAMWEKFLFIAPASGIGAVSRAPFGALRAVRESRDLLRRAMTEVLAVARARGVGLDDGIVPRTLAFIDSLPPDATASMQRDLAAGRPSELEAQVGAVVRLGRETGVATPVHEMLYACLLPLELAARRRL